MQNNNNNIQNAQHGTNLVFEKYKSANKGYLFNKVYFAKEYYNNNASVLGINEALKCKSAQKTDDLKMGYQHISFDVLYPGIITGIGYLHDVNQKEVKDDAYKIGMFFDFTSGLPIIPGSSVKGLLRSPFKVKKSVSGKKGKGFDYTYIKQVIKGIIAVELSDDEVLEFENSVFSGINGNGKHMNITQRDIFHDAIISSDSKLLGDDYITHHSCLIKEPVPIKFLKVRVGSKICFNFDLKVTTLSTDKVLLNLEQKVEIFARIIEDLGIGGKTNVGYGNLCSPQFDVSSLKEIAQKREEEEKEKAKLAKEEKNQEEINNASGIRKQMLIIQFKLGKTDNVEELSGLYNALKDGNIEDLSKEEVAKFIKEVFIVIHKWDGKLSKRQMGKIKYIKEILVENVD